MGSIAVLVKHSGKWNYEQQYEEYISDVILLSLNSTYDQLYTILAAHVDLKSKYIEIEYQLTDSAVKIRIHNDMGLKVYIMQKKELKESSILPLYVSVSERDNFSTMVNSSLCNSGSLKIIVSATNVGNTSSERALMVTPSEECLDVFEMDTSKVIISDPHHKHIEVDQVYVSKRVLQSVMKGYSIQEKFRTLS
ncbi:hypothetical protein P3L10_018037 [Capsicum annuum]